MTDDGQTVAALDEGDRLAYLRRIGVDRPPAVADKAALVELHRAHLMAVPFENLDIHIGRPIVLDIERIVAKIVEENRGGFCYELNGGFAALLASCGFKVSLLEARVHTATRRHRANSGNSGDSSNSGDTNGSNDSASTEGDGMDVRFGHLCLKVDLEQPLLIDVGFGDLFVEPVVLKTSDRQANGDPAIGEPRFHIEAADDPEQAADGWFDLFKNGEPQYRFITHPGSLADFEPGCHHHQTSTDSPFTRDTVCSRPTDSGRVTLSGLTLTETGPDGPKTERGIEPNEIGQILRSRFDISLNRDELSRLESRTG